MNVDSIKRAVGYAAADRFVTSGMKVGMGTGSTAVWAIRRIGERLASCDLSDIVGVPTSTQSEMECHKLGIPLRALNDPEIGGHLDITIDGADEIDPQLRLVKGGGGALLIEKVTAYASDKMVVVADPGKLVEHLGLAFAVPNEVLPLARVPVTRAMEALGATVEVRMAQRKMGAVITDNGNILLDIRFAEPFDPHAMETRLSQVPGVLGNGIFSRITPVVLIGRDDGRVDELSAR